MLSKKVLIGITLLLLGVAVSRACSRPQTQATTSPELRSSEVTKTPGGPSSQSDSPDFRISEFLNNLRNMRVSATNQEMLRSIHRSFESIVDKSRIARRVLGPRWKKLNPQQQMNFVEEYFKLFSGQHATQLAKFQLCDLEVADVRRKETKANVYLKPCGSKSIIYRTHYQPESGEWKIYAVIVDNIGLVTSQRVVFIELINKQGLERLLSNLPLETTEKYPWMRDTTR